MYGYGYSPFIKSASSSGTPVDPDAQAFITAAAITDPTQQSAINTLVVDLKGYGIWTKMKALYPFVGGTASQHKWNLKDPRDLNAAYRLVFSGGWTHSANGALPNGTNAFADTFLNNNVLAQNSNHISAYSRTNSNTASTIIASFSGTFGISIYPRQFDAIYFNNNSTTQSSLSNIDSRGFFLNTRRNSTQILFQKNSTQNTISNSSTTLITTSFKISKTGDFAGEYSNRELSFSSIGDGLTDTEAANFYTAVQTFQTTLGRSIGTQTVSDADAQAFVTNAAIIDQVEANAVNNLVIGLKADGLWSKMKAIYPFVGGTATSNSYNLKNTAQFQITWNGGVTHSSTGVTGNGTNGYGNTGLLPSTQLSLNNTHISYYTRTNNNGSSWAEAGVLNSNQGIFIIPKFDGSTTGAYRAVNSSQVGPSTSPTDVRGLYIASRISSGSMKLYRNSSTLFTDNQASGALFSLGNVFLLASNVSGSANYFSARQTAFASIGDGLSDTEAANLYTRVQTFNTTLNRQV